MNKEEINKVFEWLEKNANKDDFFYFRIQNVNQITAYWKKDNKPFAQFYVKPILKLIEESDK